ncbi:MAG: tetratricopeptide repeat protein [Methanosarcina barkeri]|nr:tetratricopeptide repeat protein [Methanosarcina sp. ERenArc_MAG2]
MGEPRKAIACHEQALKITQEIGDKQGEEIHLGNLGVAYSYLGKKKEAIKYYEHAAKINGEVGSRRVEGMVSCKSGISIQ